MTHNRYGATLIQDTAEFFFHARSAIQQVLQESWVAEVGPGWDPLTFPSFCSWMFAYQIERVFGLTCRGHHRRQHPNVRVIDRLHQVIDLDAITSATVRVPRIYGDQELEVCLWHDDLVIRYNPLPDPRLDMVFFTRPNATHSNI